MNMHFIIPFHIIISKSGPPLQSDHLREVLGRWSNKIMLQPLWDQQNPLKLLNLVHSPGDIPDQDRYVEMKQLPVWNNILKEKDACLVYGKSYELQ
jgi:hypothetical protein